MDKMTFEQFERLYRNIKFRPEVADLFCKIAKSNPTTISFEEFKKFVLEIQKDDWDEEKLKETFERFSGEEGMDVDHFTAYLMSSKNRIVGKQYSTENQDMDRPLNEYFINSSHNTYDLLM
jgi:Ca2+-binding EF-hand superfamily protein